MLCDAGLGQYQWWYLYVHPLLLYVHAFPTAHGLAKGLTFCKFWRPWHSFHSSSCTLGNQLVNRYAVISPWQPCSISLGVDTLRIQRRLHIKVSCKRMGWSSDRESINSGGAASWPAGRRGYLVTWVYCRKPITWLCLRTKLWSTHLLLNTTSHALPSHDRGS